MLAWRGPRRADEVPDRADRVVPPQPDPAELVHRAAVRRVKGERALLVVPRAVQVAARERHLAGQEVHVGLVRREPARLGRGGGGERRAAPAASAACATHTWVCQYAGREPPRLRRRPQRLGVVAQVHQRVGGQPVRPLLGRLDRRGPVGGLDRLGEPVGAQVRAGEQAPGPAAARLGGDQPGEQGRASS